MPVSAAELRKRLPDLPEGIVETLKAWLHEKPHMPAVAGG